MVVRLSAELTHTCYGPCLQARVPVAGAGRRKRRAEPEGEEERAAAMKSPRGDDEEHLDDVIDEIDDIDDDDMGQD